MSQATVNILIGILCIILGILIITLYSIKKKEENRKIIYLNFQTAGLILIILGVGLIVREI